MAASADIAFASPIKDLAFLTFADALPIGVRPAPLRLLRPEEVVGQRWWAFGFPDRDPLGDSAEGLVVASLACGWVRLDTTTRYLVSRGFSGGGVWMPEYEAVVGMVGQAHANGDGRAAMLSKAHGYFPNLGLDTFASSRDTRHEDDELGRSDKLHVGQSLYSLNGEYRFRLERDGNLIIYKFDDVRTVGTEVAMWKTNTARARGNFYLTLLDDGRVILDSNEEEIRVTDTAGLGGRSLVMQSDGNLVLSSDKRPVWPAL